MECCGLIFFVISLLISSEWYQYGHFHVLSKHMVSVHIPTFRASLINLVFAKGVRFRTKYSLATSMCRKSARNISQDPFCKSKIFRGVLCTTPFVVLVSPIIIKQK